MQDGEDIGQEVGRNRGYRKENEPYPASVGEKGPMSDSTQASRFWLSRKASGHPSLSPVLYGVKSKDSEDHPSLHPTFRSCPPSMGCRQDAP